MTTHRSAQRHRHASDAGDARGDGRRRGRRRRLRRGPDRQSRSKRGGRALLGKEAGAVRPERARWATCSRSLAHTPPRRRGDRRRGARAHRPPRSARRRAHRRRVSCAPSRRRRAARRRRTSRAAIRPPTTHYPRDARWSRSRTRTTAAGACSPRRRWRAIARRRARARLARAHGRRADLQRGGRARASRPPSSAARVDTVMFCLSKGLGAPVGSVLCGTTDVRSTGARACARCSAAACGRRACSRRPGSYALEHMVDRLAEDHANAQQPGRGAGLPGWTVDSRRRRDEHLLRRRRDGRRRGRAAGRPARPRACCACAVDGGSGRCGWSPTTASRPTTSAWRWRRSPRSARPHGRSPAVGV